MKTCEPCNRFHPPDDRFCCVCGAKLVDIPVTTIMNRLHNYICPVCKTKRTGKDGQHTGTFVFNKYMYERDRGSALTMLDKAIAKFDELMLKQ